MSRMAHGMDLCQLPGRVCYNKEETRLKNREAMHTHHTSQDRNRSRNFVKEADFLQGASIAPGGSAVIHTPVRSIQATDILRKPEASS